MDSPKDTIICESVASVAFEKDTITACATPPGTSALALIRISGPKSIPIVEKLSGKELSPRTPLPTRLHLKEVLLDEVVATIWPNPKSYTGEDLVELSCHGNPLIVQSIEWI
ncbi:MAG: hypothetical protein EBS60_09890 [Verrucomicrobia bacterium]|nr:hypothetical protein [Verrucomicrobiota bacterium]